MALLIEKEEAMRLLRANPKHYLWNRQMKDWSQKDVDNLRSGTNINYGNIMRDKATPDKVKYQGQPITATNALGQTLKFDSIVAAGKALGVNAQNIYALLAGRNANGGGFEFKKV